MTFILFTYLRTTLLFFRIKQTNKQTSTLTTFKDSSNLSSSSSSSPLWIVDYCFYNGFIVTIFFVKLKLYLFSILIFLLESLTNGWMDELKLLFLLLVLPTNCLIKSS